MSGWVDVAQQRAAEAQALTEYRAAIIAWLQRHFPELCEDGMPHPAAIVAVLHLHDVRGRGTLRACECGREICARVQRFNTEYGITQEAM